MGERENSAARDRPRFKGWDGEGLHRAFQHASKTRPWTAGYRSFDRDRVESVATVSGSWPEALRGTLYRNGPARHERGGLRYGHRWDGDGMLQRFSLSTEGVQHVGQYIHTAKYQADTAQGKIVTSGFGTKVPGSDVLKGSVDDANAANINVVEFAGELLALWEAGSAYRVDPVSLQTLGPKTWTESLRGKPFSAHPRVDQDGTMWNFGVDPISDELTIYRIDPGGMIRDFHTITVERISPAHDFAVTEHHLVFLLPPLTLNRERLEAGTSFAEACQWSPELGMRVLVVDKHDWSTRRLTLPPGCLFHVANAWEEGDIMHVDYMRSEDPMSLIAGWSVMAGEYRHHPGARLTSAFLDLKSGEVNQSVVGDREAEFPVIAPADVGRPHASLLCLERTPARAADLPGFDAVALHTAGGSVSRFAYGDDWLVEEHVFAAPRGGSIPRWILGTALDLQHDQTVLSIFDVRGLSDGPVAQARLPYSLPLGLHGSYVPG
jgi:all-trans-8'-apo-beta-carotenal 15,15'-oxygenase